MKCVGHVERLQRDQVLTRLTQAVEGFGVFAFKELFELLSDLEAGTDAHPEHEDTDRGSDTTNLDRLGSYRILETLGHGGMGTVYKGIHTRLQKQVAIKVINESGKLDQTAIQRFEREMVTLAQLDHFNIVRAIDAGNEGDTQYLVMDYVKGIDLSRLAKRIGTLPVADACELIRQAARGLHYAHQRGYIHRDLKPSNLMLAIGDSRAAQFAGDDESEERPPTVKILDLGLARLHHVVDSTSELTQLPQ
jgi:serine/threonine protein kinase